MVYVRPIQGLFDLFDLFVSKETRKTRAPKGNKGLQLLTPSQSDPPVEPGIENSQLPVVQGVPHFTCSVQNPVPVMPRRLVPEWVNISKEPCSIM